MANILALKRRIGAARNVSKTTKAMQMIAASKLKRAQDAVTATRPYVHKIGAITSNIMKTTNHKITHPYLAERANTEKTLLLVLSPDKGLCGSLVTNLIREFISYQKTQPNTSYIVIGKKLEGQVIHFNQEIIASFPFGTSLPTFDMVYPLINLIDQYYVGKKVDSVKVLTTEFTSVFTQKPKIINLLPIQPQTPHPNLLPKGEGTIKNSPSPGGEGRGEGHAIPASFYLYEPNPTDILNSLLKHYLEMSLYHQLIESFVSEQASRMMAMQNATDNANDIIEDLQLEYNKTRQAKITSEILDITSGAVKQI